MIRLALLILLIWGTSAEAQQQACAPRDQVVQKLEERFGETLQSLGMRPTGEIAEIYASDATGTWTILLTRPDGTTCLLAAGQMWMPDASPLTPPGDPT